MDIGLLGRRRHRPGAGRRAAGVFLVGFGVPAGTAGDGVAACAGTARSPGVPEPRGAAAGPAQRGDVAGRRAGGDLRPQADRPGRLGRTPGRLHRGRAGHRLSVPAPAAKAG